MGCSNTKNRDLELRPSPVAGPYTQSDDIEVHTDKGWAFGHCAAPGYPSMTWMEVTMEENEAFSELKAAISSEFGESAAGSFQPHCSVLYAPYKDQSFKLADANKLVE